MVGQTANWVNRHFVKTGKLGNSSNRSKYKCKHCTDHAQEIEHRDNKLLGGYVDYPMLDSQKNEADVKLLWSVL